MTNEVLQLVERLIQANADPEVVHRYFERKNQIMYGTLASPIARYQRENHELKRKAESLQQEQPKDLISWVRLELLRIFSPFGNHPATGTDLCGWAVAVVKRAEAQTRIEIERCKSNRTKLKLKIQALKQATPTETLPADSTLPEKRKAMKAFRAQLFQQKKQLRQTQKGNTQLVKAVIILKEQTKTLSERLRAISDRKVKVQEKRNELAELKANLALDVKRVTEDAQIMKITQRFGSAAKLASNRPRIDLIVGLKREIETLRKEKEGLQEKKKKIMIETMRNSQRNRIRMNVRMDM
jgi:hypothetical protein